MDLTKEEILALPTLRVGDYDDLKYYDGKIRVYLNKFEFAPDGSPQLTVERKFDRRWIIERIF